MHNEYTARVFEGGRAVRKRHQERNVFFEQEEAGLPEVSELALAEEPLFETNRKPKVHPRIIIVSALILVFLIIGGVYLYVSEQARVAEERASIALAEEEALRRQQQENEEKYNQIMNSGLFLPGITVEGVDIGGMSRSEATAALQALLADRAPKGSLSLNYGEQSFQFDLSDIATSSNLETVLDEALQLARSDNMEDALARAEEIAEKGHAFTLTSQYDFQTVAQRVAELSSQINQPAKNASIGTVDTVNHTVVLSDAVAGVQVKEEELVAAITNAILTNNMSPITIPTDTIQPTVLGEHLKMIEVSAETSFKGSTSNRIYNIKKGADLINGKVLAPGEVFSTNDVLGVRTYQNGWKEANAYVGGTTDLQAGGGVCQLSSTLYNAVVKADLEVVYRRNHSMPVSYIGKGLDATINSVGNIIDFKFANNTDSDLVIFAWTSGKTVYFKIIRSAFQTTEYDEIRLSAEKISTVYPTGEMEVIFDPMLAPGTEEIDVPTSNGSIYQSYKNYYKNGEKVRSEKLAQSTYRAYAGSKRVGPALVTPDLPPILTETPYLPVVTPEPATPVPEQTPEPVIDPGTPVPETPDIPVG